MNQVPRPFRVGSHRWLPKQGASAPRYAFLHAITSPPPLFLPSPHPLSKTLPISSPATTQFCRRSPHTAPTSLTRIRTPLCGRRKTPHTTHTPVPVFLLPQNLPPSFGNHVPTSTPLSMRFCRTFPLFHPQRLLRLAISLLSGCFFRSVLVTRISTQSRKPLCPRITQDAADIHSPAPLARNPATP